MSHGWGRAENPSMTEPLMNLPTSTVGKAGEESITCESSQMVHPHPSRSETSPAVFKHGEEFLGIRSFSTDVTLPLALSSQERPSWLQPPGAEVVLTSLKSLLPTMRAQRGKLGNSGHASGGKPLRRIDLGRRSAEPLYSIEWSLFRSQ